MIKQAISMGAVLLAFTAGVALSQDKGGKGADADLKDRG